MHLNKILSLIAFLTALCWGHAYAEELRGRFIPDPMVVNPNITWDTSSDNLSPRIESGQSSDGPVPPYSVELKGTYKQANGHLVMGNEQILTDSQGNFQIKLPIKTGLTRFEITEVNPAGEVRKYKGEVLFPKFGPIKRKMIRSKIWRFSAGFTLAKTIYQEQSAYKTPVTSNLGMLGLQGDVAFTAIPSRLDFKAGLNFGVLPFVTNDSATSVRFLRTEGKVGYHLFDKQDWVLELWAGYYYSSMLVTPPTFGFTGLDGPLLHPSVAKTFRSGNILNFYVKYSPIFYSGIGFLSLGNRELVVGGSYDFEVGNTQYIALTFEFTDLRFTLPVDGQDSGVTQSASLGVAYRF